MDRLKYKRCLAHHQVFVIPILFVSQTNLKWYTLIFVKTKECTHFCYRQTQKNVTN